MRYVAVIFLCLFGLVELVLRLAVIVVTATVVLCMVDDFSTPYCFKLADAIGRGW